MMALHSMTSSPVRRLRTKPSPRWVAVLLVVLLLAQWCQASMNVGVNKVDPLVSAVVFSEDLKSNGEPGNNRSPDSELSLESRYSAEIDRDESIASAGLHDCCPSEVSNKPGLSKAGSSQSCDNCIDDLVTEQRSVCLDTAVELYHNFLNTVEAFYHDALAQYVRYRETLWWGLSQPIYLLVGSFLE